MTNEIGLQSPTAITALQRTKRRRSKNNPGVPYAGATSGENARSEATKILRRLGCEQIGFMDDFEDRAVLLAFTHRSRNVQLRASARGWATMYLKARPYNGHRRRSRIDYEQDALRQGEIAVNSILRDQVKGSVTAIECGVQSFEAVFMSYMLTADGRTVLERLEGSDLLPKPEEPKGGAPAVQGVVTDL